MKQWLRVIYFPILIFAVLTAVDLMAGNPVRWLYNIFWGFTVGAISTVGTYLIHKNILQQEEDDEESDGCISCGRPE